MFGVFKSFVKDKRMTVLIYIIGVAVFVEMYLALFPALRDQAEMLNKLLEAYPKSLMSAFGFEGTAAFFSTVENYMSTEYFSFFWPILSIILVISFAGSMIVAEIEKGTIELVLAQPISRVKLFFSRYFASLTLFGIFSFFSIFFIVFFSILHGFDYKIENYFTTWGISFLFGATVFSIASFFSSVFSERGKAVFASAAILFTMYALNIISGLKENLDKLKYFSFFHYLNAPQLLGRNHIVDGTFLVFGGVIFVFTLAAAFWFNRRDLAT